MALANLSARLFLSLRGWLQWRVLWWMHSKFIVGVAGIITNDDGRVLLLRHRYRTPEMMWGLPSGYINKGETLEEALIREVHEETGYHIRVKSLIRMESGYQLRLEAFYLAEFAGGELRLDQREVLEARFFARDELPNGMPKAHRILINELSLEP